jgi:hypothetical protein
LVEAAHRGLSQQAEGPLPNTLKGLEAIADHVKGLPGRKNLLWVSAAFPQVFGDPGAIYYAPSGPQSFPVDAVNPYPVYPAQFGPQVVPTVLRYQRPLNGEPLSAQFKRAAAALSHANVCVYPIAAHLLSENDTGNMKDIADATGGKALYRRGEIPQGVRTALDDSREVYLLTYAPQPLMPDGTYHRIRIASSRHGIHLRYRPGYDAPSLDQTDGAETESRLTKVVASPLDVSGTGIEASLEPGRDQGGDLNVAIHINAADLNLAPNAGKWSGALRLETMQLGAAGEQLGGVLQAAELNLEPATYQRVIHQGLPFELKLKRDRVAVAVRIGVVDERGGQAGSLSVRFPPQW